MKDGVFTNGGSLQSRSEEEIFYLLEEMANYDYQWHLSQHNVQQHRDPLEDQIQALIELQKRNAEAVCRINSTLSELVQDRLLVDSMIDEEPME